MQIQDSFLHLLRHIPLYLPVEHPNKHLIIQLVQQPPHMVTRNYMALVPHMQYSSVFPSVINKIFTLSTPLECGSDQNNMGHILGSM